MKMSGRFADNLFNAKRVIAKIVRVWNWNKFILNNLFSAIKM